MFNSLWRCYRGQLTYRINFVTGFKIQEMKIRDPHNLNGIETGVNSKHYLTSLDSPIVKLKSIWRCAVTDYCRA